MDCRESADRQVVDRLRQAVRGCPHAVMVATTCLGRVLDCEAARGLHATVQPCAVDRSATGPAVLLGPLATEADAEAVGAWLRAGMPDDGTLRTGLRAAPAPQYVSRPA
ncbi:hypothetical protein [Streptomyces olivaceiscleroticus]